MTELHILNSGGAFSKSQISNIQRAHTRATKTCKKLIRVDDVDVVVFCNPNFVMPETGIGGKTQTTHIIDIPIDAERKFDPERLYLVMCHEMYHAMRQRKFRFPKTLFDA